MANTIVLNPSDGLRNVATFPTNPTTEAAARDQIQSVIDQVVEQTNTHLAEMANKIIVESGTNTNGSYVRFADGTQICYMTFNLNIALTTNQIAAVPAVFSEAACVYASFPITSISVWKDAARDLICMASASGVVLSLSKSLVGDPIGIKITVIGRWK